MFLALVGLVVLNSISWVMFIVLYNMVKVNSILLDYVEEDKEDGSYFCQECNYLVGYRRNNKEIINANFVERLKPLPSNVIKLFK